MDTISQNTVAIPEDIRNFDGISLTGQLAMIVTIQYCATPVFTPIYDNIRSIPCTIKLENNIIPNMEISIPTAIFLAIVQTKMITAVYAVRYRICKAR